MLWPTAVLPLIRPDIDRRTHRCAVELRGFGSQLLSAEMLFDLQLMRVVCASPRGRPACGPIALADRIGLSRSTVRVRLARWDKVEVLTSIERTIAPEFLGILAPSSSPTSPRLLCDVAAALARVPESSKSMQWYGRPIVGWWRVMPNRGRRSLGARNDVKRRQMTCGYPKGVDGINTPLMSQRTRVEGLALPTSRGPSQSTTTPRE